MKISNPLNAKQLKEGDLIPKGVYSFEVVNAEEAVSKSGNDMIKITLKIWMENGRERMIDDYLLEALEFKLGHFAETTGLLDQYNNKVLNAMDCIGKTGLVKIIIKSDKSGVYPDKNSVIDYVIDKPGSLLMPIKPEIKKENFISDDLPF